MRLTRILLFLAVGAALVVALWLQLTDPPAVEVETGTKRDPVPITDPERAHASSGERAAAISGGPAREEVEATECDTVSGRLLRASKRPLPAIPLTLRQVRSKKTEGLSTQTSATGAFEFEGTAAGDFIVESDSQSVPSGFRVGPFKMRKGQRVELGDIVVPDGCAVRGRVTDAYGKPMQGVLVFHSLPDHQYGFDSQVFSRWALDKDPTDDPHTRTDAAGRFELSRILPGEVTLLAEHIGFRDAKKSLKLSPGTIGDTGDLVLREGKAVRGVVTDAEGKGLPGVTVTEMRWSQVLERKAIRTAHDGSFHMRGVSEVFEKLSFEADGFIPVEIHSGNISMDPLAVKLDRMLVLRGKVVGHDGAPTTVKIDWEVGNNEKMPNGCIYEQEWKAHAVDKNGDFVIPGLIPGVYTLTATAEQRGTSLPVQARLSATSEPVLLKIVAHETLRLVVRDESGRPLAGATIVSDPNIREYPSLWKPGDSGLLLHRILRWKERKEVFLTDAAGEFALRVDRQKPVALAITLAGYLPFARMIKDEVIPERIDVTLQRAAVIRGAVDTAADARHCRIAVDLWQGSDEKPTALRSVSLDAEGRFEANPVPAGDWRVAFRRSDVTRMDDKTRRSVAKPIPVMDSARDMRTVREVHVAPGGVAHVRLVVPAAGSVRGRVVSGGRPVQGAVVWAVERGGKPGFEGLELYRASWDEPDSHRLRAHCITAADGSYRFFCNAGGIWEIRARYETSAPQPPVVVRVGRAGEQVVRDLVLPGAAIRGRFVAKIRDRKELFVRLYRLSESQEDPVFATDWRMPQSARVACSTLAADGSFVLEHLPSDSWVVRISGEFGSTLWQRVVRTSGDAVVELGSVSPPSNSAVKIPCTVPPLEVERNPFDAGWGAWIYSVERGGARVFVATVRVTSFIEAKLPPGRYEVELMRAWHNFNNPFSSFSGKSVAKKRIVVITADGKAEPARLDFSN